MFENIAFLLDILVFSILSIAWFFLSAFVCQEPQANRVMPLETCKKESKENKSNFIDNQLLKAINSHTINNDIRFRNQYIINGKVFKENIKVTKYKEFELYKLEMDDSADTSGVSIDDDTHLQLTLELVPNGFIINSNVYLTHHQWHTIYLVSEDFRRCAVCEIYCDATDHIGSSEHVANMMRFKPLHKYDLTITRKINNNYHCGVCNTLFHESKTNEHYSSKTHEDKLLFAINRVSDIMYDFNIHSNNNNKKDSYYFNVKHDYQDACMIDEADKEEEIEEEEYNYNEDDWYPLHYNDNDNEYSDEEYYEEPMPNLEFSYASMAKKPKSDDLPDVLEVDLGNKKVTVKFNSWNMLIRPMPNRMYCMACKELGHIRERAEHCASEGHLARLDACTVVDEYEKYFVRQVDDKCYHCGHCNNLQLINVMEDHIRSVHTHPTTVQALLDSPVKKISTPVKNNPNNPKTNNNEAPKSHENGTNGDKSTEIDNIKMNAVKTLFNDVAKRYNDAAAKIIINPASVFEALRTANDSFDDIVICTFGSNLRISKLAFNIICQGENDFYCGLCEVNIEKERLKMHVKDLQHLTRLMRTPFILAFNVHLFRQIRDALHCGLCNELIQVMPEFIIKHKYLEKHIVSLHRAQGHFNNNNTPAVAKNDAKQYNNAAVTKPNPLLAETTKIATTNGVTNNVSSGIKTNEVFTFNATKDAPAVTKNVAFNIPTPNVNTKIVAANKNINIAPVNSNKNEPAAGNINKVNNVGKNVPVINKNVPQNNVGTAKNVPVANKNVPQNNVATAKNMPVATKNVPPNNVATAKNMPVANKNVPQVNNVATAKSAPVSIKNEPNSVTKVHDDEMAKLKEVCAQIKNEEFVTVKNGVKEEIEEDLDDSYIEDFDLEEYVYVKLGNSYIKITNTSYNTLVDVGDGSKYCFVCSAAVGELSKHVESRGHMDNMDKFKFVDKYNEDLLRQFYLMYHCSICNVIISRKQLTHHLSWPTHALQTENTKISSKKRKTEIKTGTRQIAVTTQKENIYLNEKETEIKIFLNITIEKDKKIERLNKIVIFNDNVLKVPFDNWHGLSESSGYRCKVCQSEFEESEFGVHVSSEWHKGNLEKIEKQYSPALIRKINDTTLNCVMCNTEVANKKHLVTEHIFGKKHVKNYENMLKESSANSYADCDQDVVML